MKFMECRSGGSSEVRGRPVFVEVQSVAAVTGEAEGATVYLVGGGTVGVDETAGSFLKRLADAIARGEQ